jgi:hypothetical protein
MVTTRSCPQCEAIVSPEVWYCARCGGALPAGQQSPDAHRRYTLILWCVGLLFIGAVSLGLYLLVPHMLK